jgi:hypothetical protein
MVARKSWLIKAAALGMATIVAIGSWELYRSREAQAQLPLGIGIGALPHFKCYNFTPAGPPVRADVVLEDQFRTETVTVQTAHFLCAPVKKTHNGYTYVAEVNGPHLVCYHIHPALGTVKEDVQVHDQFQNDVGRVGTPHLLCAPATKTRL